MLPKVFKKYFWDCSFEDLKWEDYQRFIAERLLNLGNREAIQWLLKNLSKDDLKKIIDKSRALDAKTQNFWHLMLHEN